MDFKNERGAEAAAQAFSNVSDSLGHFAVLGNMEHKPGANMPGMQKVLCRAGFQFLIDDWVRIPLGELDLILVGIEDVYSQTTDLERLVGSLPERENTLRILISHSPQIVLHPLASQFDLVLSGHTHGGQVRIPFWGALYAHNPLGARFSRGLFTPEQLRTRVGYEYPPYLYISSGVGTGYARIRFACPPEFTLLRIWFAD
jgi:predicted MPP superfamily phosphohydrolase